MSLPGFVGALEHPQHAASGVGLDFFVADLAVQVVFVEALDAGLADMVGAAVVHRVERFQLFLVDPPHITHRMGEMRTLRVMPHQLGHHFHAWQAELVHRHPGDLLFVEFEQDRHRLERPTALAHALLEQARSSAVRSSTSTIVSSTSCQLPARSRVIDRLKLGRLSATITPLRSKISAGRRDRLHMHPVVL